MFRGVLLMRNKKMGFQGNTNLASRLLVLVQWSWVNVKLRAVERFAFIALKEGIWYLAFRHIATRASKQASEVYDQDRAVLDALMLCIKISKYNVLCIVLFPCLNSRHLCCPETPDAETASPHRVYPEQSSFCSAVAWLEYTQYQGIWSQSWGRICWKTRQVGICKHSKLIGQ